MADERAGFSDSPPLGSPPSAHSPQFGQDTSSFDRGGFFGARIPKGASPRIVAESTSQCSYVDCAAGPIRRDWAFEVNGGFGVGRPRPHRASISTQSGATGVCKMWKCRIPRSQPNSEFREADSDYMLHVGRHPIGLRVRLPQHEPTASPGITEDLLATSTFRLAIFLRRSVGQTRPNTEAELGQVWPMCPPNLAPGFDQFVLVGV